MGSETAHDWPHEPSHQQWVEEAVNRDGNTRQPEWSESIAEGSERFMQDVLHKLEIRAKGRKVREGDGRYELREPGAAYSNLFAPENGLLSVENVFYWNELFEQSIP
jgi:putative transposase